MIHFFWPNWSLNQNSYDFYESSNIEIAKYAYRYLSRPFQGVWFHSCNTGHIAPEPDDVLLGHLSWDETYRLEQDWVRDNKLTADADCHPNTYILTPWVPNFPREWHMPHVRSQLLNARRIFALCHPRWIAETAALPVDSLQRSVHHKLVQLNMGCAGNNIPYILKRRSRRRRNFLHVSHLGSYKRFPFLIESMASTDAEIFIGSAGVEKKTANVKVASGATKNVTFLGKINNASPRFNDFVAEHMDFYIHTSDQDAQATAVLENCARGLVPLVTPGSGFTSDHAIMLTEDPLENREIVQHALAMPDEEYLRRSAGVRQDILDHHNWAKIFGTVAKTILDDMRN